MALSWNIDPKTFSTSVNPADDFFEYVNGEWIKNNPIPEEESRWGSFVILHREVEEKLKAILEDLEKEAWKGNGDAKKIADFYRTAMDTEKLDRLGCGPLKDTFGEIESVKDLEGLVRIIGRLHRIGVGAWWMPSVEQDEKQSEIMSLHLYQGGLSLPDRDYYIKEDEQSSVIREKYRNYIPALLRRSGLDMGPEEISNLVCDIERSLAKASMTRVERRDVEKQYNKKSLSEFQEETPNINWKAYFEEIKAPEMEYVIVGQPDFFEEVSRLFGELPLSDIRTYLRWHVLNSMADYLTEELERESFDFYGRTFGGAKEMKPRWRRVLSVVNGMLDQALGKLYIERHFSKGAKKKINELVDRLVEAYRARIRRLEWMSEETKQKALEKLASVSRKLGYPDVWKDYSALEVADDSYAANYMRAYAFEFDRNIAKIGKPVDRTEWHMPPQMVNAYYNPTMNEIVFPAAILQPPFFDPDADDAVNFGGIGSVIGHELTHGFDDQGSLFDKEGNLKNWWSAQDKDRFQKKTAHLAEQFDKYELFPGAHVNGKLTLGENIADLGGILIAYDGLKLALGGNIEEDPIEGLTPAQRFFVNYAIAWQYVAREELARLRLQTDPHSPPYYRVNGPFSNLPEFYSAFGCSAGNHLWRDPEDRVAVW